jgi:NAD(P)H dehydrogenase (quinone)
MGANKQADFVSVKFLHPNSSRSHLNRQIQNYGTAVIRKGLFVGKTLVTGASGDLGRKTLLHLLKLKPASQLIGLARDSSKAEDLAAEGIEVRQGDYFDPDSLSQAFKGVERLMLTSTHAFTDRKTAQGNVIDAAVDAGVRHMVSMSIIRKPGSTYTMPEITNEDKFTEEKLAKSGLEATFVYHAPFIDILGFYVGMKAQDTGVNIPVPGYGKFAPASRYDLGAAHAAILAGKRHEGKSYRLYGDPAVSFRDVATIISKLSGKPIAYNQTPDKAFTEKAKAAGIPDFVAEFAIRWIKGMDAGEWEPLGSDLATLLGRKPTSTEEAMRTTYFQPVAAA